MIFKRFYFICLFMTLLAGCVSKHNIPTTPTQKQQETLEQLETWKINGRLAFRSDEKRVSAYLNWQQQQKHYRVSLNSFVGTSLLKIEGDEKSVTLTQGQDEYYHYDPNTLLYDITGWDIPLLQLQHWVKGYVNDEQVNAIYDELGFLTELHHNQSHWHVTYSDYKLVKSLTLPHLIEISKDDKLIKIKIKQWQLNGLSQ